MRVNCGQHVYADGLDDDCKDVVCGGVVTEVLPNRDENGCDCVVLFDDGVAVFCDSRALREQP